MYKRQPVRREVLFAVDFVNGILIMAVPYVISMIAAACIAVGYGCLLYTSAFTL